MRKESCIELHAIIYGDVQGVGFRAAARQHARRLKLKGCVKNLPDGSVEVCAVGPEEAVAELLQILRNNIGRVESVDAHYFQPKNHFEDFNIVESM